MTETTSRLTGVAVTMSGMVAGTDVMTADGALSVEHLFAGDRVVTRSGLRVLRAVAVSFVPRAAMVQIAGDALGIGRPDRSVQVAAGQGVLIRDWRARALFGTAQAVIPAARLVDGQFILAMTQTDVRLFSLRFDEPAVIHAGGLELACPSEPATAVVMAERPTA